MADSRRVIGLLGGSFNPAHAGHLHISLVALKKLKLDEVWWLVSPGNPLKDPKTLASFEARFASAEKLATHPNIKVSNFEQLPPHRLAGSPPSPRRGEGLGEGVGIRYTYQTIARLKKRYPRVQFVWLMGADNLAQFHRWQRWAWILSQVPVVVFDRAPYSHGAKAAIAYHKMRKYLLKDNMINSNWRVPSLYYMHLKRDSHSSTKIRLAPDLQTGGGSGRLAV
ncbi:MAG: nicotinate-nucleotide adenylyltransferase [Alphaproteobacteria bacterium]|nr:nicotinate-nucleotide adenylyltransferase [Alphaproteobacteria bacterium]